MITLVLDANGKLPSGVLLGNFLWPGKYHECTDILVSRKKNESDGFHGMYCVAQWNISVPAKVIISVCPYLIFNVFFY